MDAAPSRETSSAVEDFKQLPMMNSRTACRKLDEVEDECDGDDEDIITATGRRALRIDVLKKGQRRDGKAVEREGQRTLGSGVWANDRVIKRAWGLFVLGRTLDFLVVIYF